MPSALTLGENSYVTDLATANTYFDDTLNNAEWSSYSDDDKTRALIQSSRTLEYNVSWLSTLTKFSDSQTLQFPLDVDEVSTVPSEVLWVTCEYALLLLEGDQPTEDGDAVRRVKIGDTEVEFSVGGSVSSYYPIPDSLMELLDDYGSYTTVEQYANQKRG